LDRPRQHVRGWRDFLGAWKNLRGAAEGYRELDGEAVLVLFLWSGRGKTSGLELGQLRTKGAHLFCLRDGKVVKSVLYFDRDRAFADLGLEPDTGAP
jgi:hypothetical protein